MQVKKNLKHWKDKIGKLPSPKKRPNDFQRLVLECIQNGMNIRDAWRIFDISESSLRDWRKLYGEVKTDPDQLYFMRRARELGADDEVIALWFGFDRADKVSMLLAEK
jgi:transposase-like protein